MVKEAKMRLMDDYVAGQKTAVAVAKWENALQMKDAVSSMRRMGGENASSQYLTAKNIGITRREKMQELFKADEERYRAELNAMGLTFRTETV